MKEERGRSKENRTQTHACFGGWVTFRPWGFFSRSTQVTVLCKQPNLTESESFKTTKILSPEERNKRSKIGSVWQALCGMCFPGLDKDTGTPSWRSEFLKITLQLSGSVLCFTPGWLPFLWTGQPRCTKNTWFLEAVYLPTLPSIACSCPCGY